MSTRTIYHAGFEFDVAEADGELLAATLDSREELIAETDWPYSSPDGMPHPASADEDTLERWALEYFREAVQERIDWPLWSEADRNGVGVRDFYGARGA